MLFIIYYQINLVTIKDLIFLSTYSIDNVLFSYIFSSNVTNAGLNRMLLLLIPFATINNYRYFISFTQLHENLYNFFKAHCAIVSACSNGGPGPA
jgi:hypothetical protein